MPPRVMSNTAARAAFNGPASKGAPTKPTATETELKKMFQRLQNVVTFLDREGHGGKIIVPLPPNLTNAAGAARGAWYVEEALKRAYRDHLNELLLRRLIPKPPGRAPLFVRVTTAMFVEKTHDIENLTARMKWPVDWLRGNGYMFDDSPLHSDRTQPTQVKVPRSLARIEFTIEEVDP